MKLLQSLLDELDVAVVSGSASTTTKTTAAGLKQYLASLTTEVAAQSTAVAFAQVSTSDPTQRLVYFDTSDALITFLENNVVPCTLHLLQSITIERSWAWPVEEPLLVEGNGYTITIEPGVSLLIINSAGNGSTRLNNLDLVCLPGGELRIEFNTAPIYATGGIWQGLTFVCAPALHLTDVVVNTPTPSNDQTRPVTLWLNGAARVINPAFDHTVIVDNSITAGGQDTTYLYDMGGGDTIDLAGQPNTRRVMIFNSSSEVYFITNGTNPLLRIYIAPDSPSPTLQSGNITLAGPRNPIPADGESFVLLSRRTKGDTIYGSYEGYSGYTGNGGYYDNGGSTAYYELARCFYE